MHPQGFSQVPERLLTHTAVLARAPSAHNTQPWQLQRTGDGSLELSYELARLLPVADATRRDLLLSLGAFIEVAMIVAAEHQYAIAFEPALDHRVRRVGRFVASPAPPKRSHTCAEVQARQSGRGRYAVEALRADALAAAQTAAMSAGLRVVPIEATDVVAMLRDGGRHMWGDEPTARELKSWLRLDKRDARYECDGLSYEALDMSAAEAAVLRAMLSRGVWPWLRRMGGPALLGSFSLPVVKRRGTVLALIGETRDDDAMLDSGAALLRTWLELSRHGCHTHPLSEIIDARASNRALHMHLGLDPDGAWSGAGERVLALFRAGRSSPPVRSHRRTDFVVATQNGA
ncbi:MAG: hypothetical protein JWN41_1397 [Thermoleophilia bacterium]|nr:hypothetical protein [Thermoleophilia bacterium]